MHQTEGVVGTAQGDEAIPAQPLQGGIATALPSATTTVESATDPTPPDEVEATAVSILDGRAEEAVAEAARRTAAPGDRIPPTISWSRPQTCRQRYH